MLFIIESDRNQYDQSKEFTPNQININRMASINYINKYQKLLEGTQYPMFNEYFEDVTDKLSTSN